jgi:hypothetical protein
MSRKRAKAKFVEADIRRVLAAAKKADVRVSVEIATDGRIVVVTGPSGEAGNTTNPWDKVLDGAATDKERTS